MRIRFSTCIGTNIVCDSLNEVIGQIAGILIHPDTGKIEGFYVAGSYVHGGSPFLASLDIVRWGKEVHVQESDAVYPVEERIRLQPILSDPRRVLWQRIFTENGRRIGTCSDVQFNTDSMRCEWLFPRKWWKWSAPLPLSDIVEIRPDAILVRDQTTLVKERIEEESGPMDLLESLQEIGRVPEGRISNK